MKKIKKGIKKIVSSIFYIIVAFIYIIKGLLHFIDKTIPKLFMKAPRLFRQCTIYTMAILSIMCFMGRDYGDNTIRLLNEKETYNKPEIETEIQQEPLADEEQKQPEVEPAELENVVDYECELSGVECLIYFEAQKQGLSKEQAYIIMAISKQETGHWNSDAYLFLNNSGGIMNGNKLKEYPTIKDGVIDLVTILKKYYFNQGLDTLEKIQKKYCPIGASNDPTGLNNYWLKNTTIFLNEYLGGK